MNRSDFFKQIIDNYLFLDLRNMAGLEQKDGEGGGAASYPMLATCVSGIELLGGLLSPQDYNHKNDKTYFIHYWDEYLVKTEPKYMDYAELFWRLVRNSVAHTYMAKVAITVTKGDKANNLVFHSDDNRFNIDCVAFYWDFKKSYDELVKPKLITNDSFTEQVDKNIAGLLTESETLCDEVLAPLRTVTRDQPIVTVSTGADSFQTPSGINIPAGTTTVIPDDVRQKLTEAQVKLTIPNTTFASGASMLTQEATEDLKNAKIISTKKDLIHNYAQARAGGVKRVLSINYYTFLYDLKPLDYHDKMFV